MYTAETTVINETGLHARPASVFVLRAKEFGSKITVRDTGAGRAPVNAKSIVCLLAQGIGCGARIEIAAQGPDEEQAVCALKDLIEGGFGEN
ncbi:MAG: HPr family phosphocarrier protein [Oscillospiraceae bacterium]|nr:HPr family phosphocarrier protein [Oscillospiraceae bacterium]